MRIESFVISVVMTIMIVGSALIYLRGITRGVLRELCPSDAAAEYWLRTTDVLALAGSMLLVVAFGGAAPADDLIAQMRLTLGLALAGLFVAVVFVSSGVWRQVRDAAGPTITAEAV